MIILLKGGSGVIRQLQPFITHPELPCAPAATARSGNQRPAEGQPRGLSQGDRPDHLPEPGGERPQCVDDQDAGHPERRQPGYDGLTAGASELHEGSGIYAGVEPGYPELSQVSASIIERI